MGRSSCGASGTGLLAKMREVGAALAGEMSGHLFFAHRYLGYDDAIYAAARLLELLSHDGRPLSAHVDTLPRLHRTPSYASLSLSRKKGALVARIAAVLQTWPGIEVNALDGVRIHWPDAWALVRASNTKTALVLRFSRERRAPSRCASAGHGGRPGRAHLPDRRPSAPRAPRHDPARATAVFAVAQAPGRSSRLASVLVTAPPDRRLLRRPRRRPQPRSCRSASWSAKPVARLKISSRTSGARARSRASSALPPATCTSRSRTAKGRIDAVIWRGQAQLRRSRCATA